MSKKYDSILTDILEFVANHLKIGIIIVDNMSASQVPSHTHYPANKDDFDNMNNYMLIINHHDYISY
jgi:hypothetical protein